MTLIFMEGWDHMATAAKYPAKGWTNSANVNPTTGRFGGSALVCDGSNNTKVLPSTYTELFCGFAFKANSSFSPPLFLLLSAAGATLTQLGITGSKLTVQNSSGTTVATGTTALVLGLWYYIEYHVIVNGASSTVEVRLNGVSGEIPSQTVNLGTSTAIGQVQYRCQSGGGPTHNFDDCYICDSTGSAPRNTFLGDVKIVTLMPNADGSHSDWTPNSGTVHNDRVKETANPAPDDDTTYNSDATVGHVDTYAFADLTDTSATVFGVQVSPYLRKDDASVRQTAPVIRQSGTDYVGTTVTLGSSYAFFPQIYEQDPTAAAWTPTNINADEFGIKTIA